MISPEAVGTWWTPSAATAAAAGRQRRVTGHCSLQLALIWVVVVLVIHSARGQGLQQTAAAADLAADTAGALVDKANNTPRVPVARLQELAQQWRLTKEEAEALGEPHGAGKMRICVDPFTPGVVCEPGSPQHSKFTGFWIATFRDLSREVPWLADSGLWYISCMNTHAMYDALAGRGIHGSCMMGVSGLPSLESLVERGIRPSWALDKEGMMIMTTTSPDTHTGLWAPFSAFTWQVWACLISTTLFVPVVLWVLDMADVYLQLPTKRERREGRQLLAAVARSQLPDEEAAAAAAAANAGDPSAAAAPELQQQLGATRPPLLSEDWYMLHFHTPKAQAVDVLLDHIRRSAFTFIKLLAPPDTSTPALLVVFGYGLLSMLMVALYTASATANLMTNYRTPAVTSFEDLKGRAVGTWEDYAPPLAEEGLPTVPFKWNNPEDEEEMLRALASGFVSALVLPERFVRYVTSRRCNFVAVGQPFEVIDQGYAYNRRLAPELADDLDRYLQGAVQAGLLEKMARLYIDESSHCLSAATVDKSKGVSLGQVWGLWLVLAICIGLAGALNALQWVRRRKLRRAQELAAQAVARAVRSSANAARQVMSPARPSKQQQPADANAPAPVQQSNGRS